jgi:hypothetical protein
MFVPPYDEVTYGIIKKMANVAEQSRLKRNGLLKVD